MPTITDLCNELRGLLQSTLFLREREVPRETVSEVPLESLGFLDLLEAALRFAPEPELKRLILRHFSQLNTPEAIILLSELADLCPSSDVLICDVLEARLEDRSFPALFVIGAAHVMHPNILRLAQQWLLTNSKSPTAQRVVNATIRNDEAHLALPTITGWLLSNRDPKILAHAMRTYGCTAELSELAEQALNSNISDLERGHILSACIDASADLDKTQSALLWVRSSAFSSEIGEVLLSLLRRGEGVHIEAKQWYVTNRNHEFADLVLAEIFAAEPSPDNLRLVINKIENENRYSSVLFLLETCLRVKPESQLLEGLLAWIRNNDHNLEEGEVTKIISLLLSYFPADKRLIEKSQQKLSDA